MGRVAGHIIITDTLGNFQKVEVLAGYEVTKIDEAGDPKYYGAVDSDGNWYIRRVTSDTSHDFARGTTNFSTNWTGRAALDYADFDSVF